MCERPTIWCGHSHRRRAAATIRPWALGTRVVPPAATFWSVGYPPAASYHRSALLTPVAVVLRRLARSCSCAHGRRGAAAAAAAAIWRCGLVQVQEGLQPAGELHHCGAGRGEGLVATVTAMALRLLLGVIRSRSCLPRRGRCGGAARANGVTCAVSLDTIACPWLMFSPLS